jgi:acyl-CoA reductase-like NAD-dependent aldehyde dehydrogenase
VIAKIRESTPQEASNAIIKAYKAWPQWASIPAPARGDIVRQIGDELRKNLTSLGSLVSLEMGKSLFQYLFHNEILIIVTACIGKTLKYIFIVCLL